MDLFHDIVAQILQNLVEKYFIIKPYVNGNKKYLKKDKRRSDPWDFLL